MKKYKKQGYAIGGKIKDPDAPMQGKLKEDKAVEVAVAAPKYDDLEKKWGNAFIKDPKKKKALIEAWDREHPKPRESMPYRQFADGGELGYQQKIKSGYGWSDIAKDTAAGSMKGGMLSGGIALASGFAKKFIGDKARKEQNAIIQQSNNQRELQAATAGITGATDIDNSDVASMYENQSATIANKYGGMLNTVNTITNSLNEVISTGQEVAKKAVTGGLKDGGVIKGKGTGKSDSIKAHLTVGDFIVPAENADKAKVVRKKHFGDDDSAPLHEGKEPVKVSNGEVLFTKEEMEYLDEIGEGTNVRKLAPNAREGNKYAGGGELPRGKVDKNGKLTDPKEIAIEQAYRDSLLKSDKYSLDNGSLVKVSDKMQSSFERAKPAKVKTDLAKLPDYQQMAADLKGKGKVNWGKVGKFTGENAGAILGGVQAITGLVQGAKNAKEERALKPIKSNAAIANSEAIETKASADKAASAIMAGNEAESDRAMGNYMRLAKESGGANSATVLANASRVGQSSSDAYIKGMTEAARMKLAGQQASSEMKIKAGEQATQVDQYNDQAKRRLLEQKSANSNAMLSAGLQNTGMALARSAYNKKMDYLGKNVKNNLTGQPLTTATTTTSKPFTKSDNGGVVPVIPLSDMVQSSTMPIQSPYSGYVPPKDELTDEKKRQGNYRKGGMVKKYKRSKC